MKEQFALNTGLLPLADVGTYGSWLDASYYEDNLNDCREDGDPLYEIDYDKYKEAIVDVAKDWIRDNVADCLKKYGVEEINIHGMWSPRFYNFETDQLDFDVVMGEGWRDKRHAMLQEFKKDPKYDEFVRDHWWSRDGFLSFMPQSIDELESGDDEIRELAGYLTLCLVYEDVYDDIKESNMRIYEILQETEYDYDFIRTAEEEVTA